MAFPEYVIDWAWKRSGGMCECARISCGHTGRCAKYLTTGNWNAHHKTAVASGGDDTLSNCEILCIPCHHNTETFGG